MKKRDIEEEKSKTENYRCKFVSFEFRNICSEENTFFVFVLFFLSLLRSEKCHICMCVCVFLTDSVFILSFT